MNTRTSMVALLCLAALSAGCDKNAVRDITEPSPGGA
jgi:hypothetical protein